MRTKLVVACALTAFVAVSGATAEATGLIHTSAIAKGAITFNRLSPGVRKMVSAKPTPGKPGEPGLPGVAGAAGVPGATGLRGPDGLNGADGLPGATGPQGLKGLKGDTGLNGLKGDTGLNGLKGDTGLNGLKGDKGDAGTNGAPGLKGDKGDKGDAGTNGAPGLKGDKGDKGDPGTNGTDGHDGADAPAREYGVVKVNVARGAGAVSTWATYSTALGSPVGDNTGGDFRFTCNATHAANGGCRISVTSYVTGSAHGVYPRLVIYKQGDGAGGGTLDEQYCEYLDGPVTAVSGPTGVQLAAGGSFDCGVTSVVDHTDANFGQVVNELTVPAGYYDVHSTFSFLP
jgi:hypothetical protein